MAFAERRHHWADGEGGEIGAAIHRLGGSAVRGFAVQSGGTVRTRSKRGEGTMVEPWLTRAGKPASEPEPFRRSGASVGFSRPMADATEGDGGYCSQERGCGGGNLPTAADVFRLL
jgi:hypothetical protein